MYWREVVVRQHTAKRSFKLKHVHPAPLLGFGSNARPEIMVDVQIVPSPLPDHRRPNCSWVDIANRGYQFFKRTGCRARENSDVNCSKLIVNAGVDQLGRSCKHPQPES